MRTGIFGGTFNPPHSGHKKLALEMKKAAGLDRVIIIPTCQPPHKNNSELVDSQHRLEMCRLMFCEEFFTVSDIEVKRTGKSYTYDTVCQLRKEYPDDELFLIIGSDMLLSFDRWYRYKDILSMVRLAVATRENEVTTEALCYYAENSLLLKHNEYIIADIEPFECSSTFLRGRIKENEDVSLYLSASIISYISENNLYSMPYPEYTRLIEGKLDEYRYKHSLGVAQSSSELAVIYGYDKDKAYLAGLLHDIMKNASFEEQLQIMEKGGIILNQVEKNNKALWHAMAGEAYLRVELGINDEDILNSVRYHTTGRQGMSLLEKIVYVADYISAERNYPDVEVMRDLAKNSSLEAASLYALKFSFGKFTSEGRVIHTDSVDYYNELIIEMKGMN